MQKSIPHAIYTTLFIDKWVTQNRPINPTFSNLILEAHVLDFWLLLPTFILASTNPRSSSLDIMSPYVNPCSDPFSNPLHFRLDFLRIVLMVFLLWLDTNLWYVVSFNILAFRPNSLSIFWPFFIFVATLSVILQALVLQASLISSIFSFRLKRHTILTIISPTLCPTRLYHEPSLPKI